MLKENEFQCAMCREVFDKGWTEEEAEEEMRDLWGDDITKEDCGIVCDDCFRKLPIGSQ